VFNGSRLGKEFSANVFNDLFAGKGDGQEKSTYKAGASFEPFDNTFSEKEEGSVIGGLFDLFSPEAGSDTADNIEEQFLTRRMKKRRKRQRHM
jgi:hypothetical protein